MTVTVACPYCAALIPVMVARGVAKMLGEGSGPEPAEVLVQCPQGCALGIMDLVQIEAYALWQATADAPAFSVEKQEETTRWRFGRRRLA